jgi:hypothetical protein
MNPKKIRRLMNKYGLFCPIRAANPYRRMAKAMQTSKVAPQRCPILRVGKALSVYHRLLSLTFTI